jgi:hypothetical protein
MSQQLERLVDVTRLPNATIQVVPFAAGLHSGVKGAFELVHFEDTPDEDIVFLEGPHDDFIIETPEETKDYLETFRNIKEISLNPSDSERSLLKAARDLA